MSPGIAAMLASATLDSIYHVVLYCYAHQCAVVSDYDQRPAKWYARTNDVSASTMDGVSDHLAVGVQRRVRLSHYAYHQGVCMTSKWKA
jgi:hypothetical protein